MGKGVIDISIFINGEVKIFLTPNDKIGEEILNQIASGEFVINKVGSNYQLPNKNLSSAIVLEKVKKEEL